MIKFLNGMIKPSISSAELLLLLIGNIFILYIFDSLLLVFIFSFLLSCMINLLTFGNILLLCSFLPLKMKLYFTSLVFTIYTGHKVTVTKFFYE